MADIAELIVALKLRDGVSSGLGRLNGQLKGMQGGLSQVGTGIGQVGTGLDRLATRGAIAAAAGLGAVVTAAVSFEDAFAGVRKTVDATEDQFDQLDARLREMARTMPVSFEELAGIAEAGGALGIAFEGLDEFTKVVADLAATTDLSADQAATSLGVLGNVLDLRAEDFDNFGSALVDLGNKGASTESAILDISERIGATGALIGLTSDQVLGFGAAVANVGIEAEAGGSALQRFFIDALSAVESGGEDLETFARTAGATAEQFRDSFRDDAGAALADFIEGLGKLPEAVQIETLQDLGFNDVRITRTLLGLATDADNLTDSLNISAQAFAANSALGEEAAKRYATTASQLKILKQNVTDAAVTIGSELLPVVGELTSEFVEFLNQTGTQEGLRDFATGLAEGVRGLANELKGTDFSGIIGGIQIAAQVAKTAFDAFRALPEPLQQLAVAAFAVNKISGGAIGQIAAGLGNILLGSLKTITAGNVTVIGANVTGLGGAAGKAGGGVIGGLKAGAALAAVPLAGAAAVEVINFQDMRAQSTATLEEKLDNLERSNLEVTQASIDKIQAQIEQERPWFEGILFNTNVRPILERELAELTATKLQHQANAMAAMQADRVMISTANQQLTNMREQARLANAALSSDQAMLQTARTQTGQNATANALLGGINAKDFSPNVYVQARFNLSSSVIVNGMVQAATVSGTSTAASTFTPI